MNILIITQLLPYPLSSGGAQAQYHIIEQLRQHHNVALLYVEDRNNTAHAAAQLRERWPNVTFLPFTLRQQLRCPRFLRQKELRACNLLFRKNAPRFQTERILDCYGLPIDDGHFRQFVRQCITEHRADLLEIDFFPCLPIAEWGGDLCPTVFIHHEIRFVRNARMLEAFLPDAALTQRWEELKQQEIHWLNRCHHVITLTDKDAQILQEAGVRTPIAVSPAAVNTPQSTHQPFRNIVTFLGGSGHAPNLEGMQWFVKEVFPLLAPEVQAALQFHIVGKGWDNFSVPPTMRFQPLGFVEELHSALAGSVMIIPLLSGSGMRMKILESAALQVPFLTTTVGVEGLDFAHEEHCLIADTPAEFAAALTRLTSDAQLQAQLTRKAAQRYEEKYSVRSLATLRQSLLERMASPETTPA